MVQSRIMIPVVSIYIYIFHLAWPLSAENYMMGGLETSEDNQKVLRSYEECCMVGKTNNYWIPISKLAEILPR